MNRVLVIGYGNPGRLDDGLGPTCAESIERMRIPGVSVDADYQLTVETACAAAQHEYVVFADASVGCPEPFVFRPVHPAGQGTFSTHLVEPEDVMALARDLFRAGTKGYTLGIRGYEFDAFGEILSAKASDNLAAALRFIVPVLRDCSFDAALIKGAGELPAEVRNRS